MSNSNLSFILKTLLSERAEYSNIAIPVSQHEQRELMRLLLNVRLPLPLDEAFCAAQDADRFLDYKTENYTKILSNIDCVILTLWVATNWKSSLPSLKKAVK